MSAVDCNANEKSTEINHSFFIHRIKGSPLHIICYNKFI